MAEVELQIQSTALDPASHSFIRRKTERKGCRSFQFFRKLAQKSLEPLLKLSRARSDILAITEIGDTTFY